MDKNILHSILESTDIGTTLDIKFYKMFDHLSGKYQLISSKVGRGRGGSRIIEIQSLSDRTQVLSSLTINGEEKKMGTSVSDYIITISINDKIYGLEDPLDMKKEVKITKDNKKIEKLPKKLSEKTIICQKVANKFNEEITKNNCRTFKVVTRPLSSPLNGEWVVKSYHYENDVMKISFEEFNNSENKFDFDSSVHGLSVKELYTIEIS